MSTLSNIRWDHGQALLTAEGEYICSACFKAIPEDHAPLQFWKNHGVDMATFCVDCEPDALAATLITTTKSRNLLTGRNDERTVTDQTT